MENVSSMEESIADYRQRCRIAGKVVCTAHGDTLGRALIRVLVARRLPGLGPEAYSLKIQMMRRTALMVKRISRATKGPQIILASRRAAGLRAASASS